LKELIEMCLSAVRKKGYKAEFHQDRNSAVRALLCELPAEWSVGIGGSITITELDLPRILNKRGQKTSFHWLEDSPENKLKAKRKARLADAYLCSINALTSDGEIIQIDGQGNRISSMIFGHKKVFLICGINKITSNLESAMTCAKNSAVKNARRLELNTPCVRSGHCQDCDSPQRICRVTTILDRCPEGAEIKIIIIGENLGY
jgi:LUD domain